ncbi:MAG: hypothetical protein D3923_07505 [Candidatus Electrothrix sp. AR3]|nr:hypothetical protein [Candidatus Electrothrix sp. AR3]
MIYLSIPPKSKVSNILRQLLVVMANAEFSEEEYNAKFIGLADECPIHRLDPTCPLTDMRKMKFKQKLQWLRSLPLEKKKELYQYHIVCFSKDW